MCTVTPCRRAPMRNSWQISRHLQRGQSAVLGPGIVLSGVAGNHTLAAERALERSGLGQSLTRQWLVRAV